MAKINERVAAPKPSDDLPRPAASLPVAELRDVKPRTTSDMKVIGFGLGRAGLSNQKLALLGLFAKALEGPCAVALPRLCNFSTSRGATTDIEFREIFDLNLLMNFAKDIGVEIRDTSDVELLPFRDIFLLGSRTSNAGLQDADSLSAKFWRALRPNALLDQKIESLARQVFREHRIQAVAQLRIEPDWQKYVATTLHSRKADDVPTTYQEILQKVARTLGESAKKILLTCDETQVPIDEITRYAEDSLGMSVAFKGEFLSDIAADQFTVRTSLDFGLALRSDIFVGTSHSTFTNTLYATKVAMSPSGKWKHYIYYSTAEILVPRNPQYQDIPKNSALLIHASQNEGLFIGEPYISVDQYRSPLPVVLRAHLAYQGDRISMSGWVRPVNDKRTFQGFSIDITGGMKCDIRYRARLANGAWTDWVRKGQFVGTRGKSENLTGFSVRLEGADREKFRLDAIGQFTKDLDFVVAHDGEECVPVSGDGFLSGMQVILRAKSEASSFDAAAPSFLGADPDGRENQVTTVAAATAFRAVTIR